MPPSPFLAQLTAAVEAGRATARTEFAPLPPALLNQRPAPASWSILECLEHLNRYSRYYKPWPGRCNAPNRPRRRSSRSNTAGWAANRWK